MGIDAGDKGQPAQEWRGRSHLRRPWVGHSCWACRVCGPPQGFWFGDGAVGVEDTRTGLLRRASSELAIASTLIDFASVRPEGYASTRSHLDSEGSEEPRERARFETLHENNTAY
jgi:hypothetical protein